MTTTAPAANNTVARAGGRPDRERRRADEGDTAAALPAALARPERPAPEGAAPPAGPSESPETADGTTRCPAGRPATCPGEGAWACAAAVCAGGGSPADCGGARPGAAPGCVPERCAETPMGAVPGGVAPDAAAAGVTAADAAAADAAVRPAAGAEGTPDA